MTNIINFGRIPKIGGFRQEGFWVWCGSVIEEPGNGFHMYAARWPKTHPMFEGYILMSEIVRAWSPTMEGPYKFIEKVLPSGNASEWCGRMMHNPAILKHQNKYLLYFIGSTYDHAIPPADKIKECKPLLDAIYNRIRIGLAMADSPSGPWKVLPSPILEPRPDKWDSNVVTNPAPCIHPDGRIFLYYRSNTPEGLRIGLAVADSPEGHYQRVQDAPVISNYNIEDPFVWHDGSRFCMLAKDISGTITGEANSGACFVSDDGISWNVAGTPQGYSKRVTFDDGKSELLGCLERPQLLFDEKCRPKCFYAAAADGPGHFRNAINTWNIAIPICN